MNPGLSRVALVVLCSTVFVSVISASMTTVALPDLQADFGVGPDSLSWVLTAYIVTFAGGTVLYGRLADIAGTKRMYVLGLLLFAGASFALALAPTFWILVGLRAVQGFGATAIPALSMATIVRSIPTEERGPALGATIVAVGVGFGLGPLIGGALTDLGSWRLPFLATGLIVLVILPLAIRAIPGLPGQPGQRLDLLGAALLGAAMAALVIALNRLPRDLADPLGLACAAATVPLVGLLALRLRSASQPVISPAVLRNGRFLLQCGTGLTSQGVHFGTIYLLPLLFTERHGLSVTSIGLHLLPGALLIGAFGMAGGALLRRLGASPLIVTGCSIMLVGALLLHLGGVGGSAERVAAQYALLAAGYGMVNAAIANSATSELQPSLAGVGVGVFNLFFFLGGAISVALAGGILRSREDATSALDPLFQGNSAFAYSDAMLVVVGLAILGLALALVSARQPRKVSP